jgi:hypothetical protein
LENNMSKLVLHSQVTGERIHLHRQSNGRLLVTVDDVTFPIEIRMEAVKGAKVPAVPRIWVPGLDDRKPAPVVAAAPVVEAAAPATVVVEAEKPAETVVSDSATRRRRRGATSEEQVEQAPAAVAAPVVEAVAVPETPVASE